MKKLSDKCIYLGIIILLAYFIFRLVDQSKIITFFPLDYVNDVSSVMAQLYFLAEFGFHQIVPYWYNGFQLFLSYYPGWFYFALPIYSLTGNLQLTWYLALIIVYILAFLLFLLLAKIERISYAKGIFFFLLFFVNPLAIGNFVRLGRTAEFFGWLFFIALFILIIYFKNRKLNKKFLWFIPLYSALILAHPMPLIFISLFIFSLFLIKSFKEKIFIVGSFLVSILISSFWWVPYVRSFGNTSATLIEYTSTLFSFEGTLFFSNLAGILSSLAFLFLFYLYYKKNKKDLLFYSPAIVLALFFLFRIVHYIPIFNKIQPDAYTLFFFFLGVYLLFKINLRSYPFLRKIIYPGLALLSILFVIFSGFYTPFFKEHEDFENQFNSLMPLIDDRYMMISSVYTTPSAKAYYSYNAIFYNITTPFGWSPQAATPELKEKLSKAGFSFRERITGDFLEAFDGLNLRYIAAFDEHCDYLSSLQEFELIKETERTCLYKK